jgi:hypothetical protein
MTIKEIILNPIFQKKARLLRLAPLPLRLEDNTKYHLKTLQELRDGQFVQTVLKKNLNLDIYDPMKEVLSNQGMIDGLGI